MTDAEILRQRFPKADERVIASLLAQPGWSDPPDDDDDYTPCPRCGRWHLADGLPVMICGCGYCAHASRDDGVCNFCGVTK